MATVSGVSSAHAPVRQTFSKAFHLLGALVVVFGSVGFASVAAHWILSGVPHASAAVHQTVGATSPKTRMRQSNRQENAPIAVGMGATQSYHGLAITIGQLQITTKHDFLAAPAGQAFAIVTVTIVNTDPVQTATYNAANFQMEDPAGALHPEAMAALASPLGIGTIAPHGRAQGTIAFLVPYPADPYKPDPAVVFLPTPNPALALAWDLPLAPSMP